MKGKRCVKCGVTKPASTEFFHQTNRNKQGLHPWCKECKNSYMRTYMKKPQAVKNHRAAKRRWRNANLEIQRAKERERYHRNPERFAAASRRYLLKKWGLTEETYAALLREQGGGCAICGVPGNPPQNKAKHLAIDHDHETGKVRGLLCDKCNRALGWFDENHDRFIRASEYLLKHRES